MIPATAIPVTWGELLRHPDVIEEARESSSFGIMAFHGGLEGGTAEMARSAADASGASLYVVAQPPELRWHVPSSLVNPAESPTLASWLAHVEVAIAIHGYGRIRRPRRLLLGGRNRQLAGVLEKAVTARLAGFEVVTDLADMPPELRGLHPDNPVNRPRSKGVQLELPPSARGTPPRPADPEWGPGGAAARIVDAIVDVARHYVEVQP